VYIMQNAENVVIYVGKAKALKNRVSQYFAQLASHTEKTRAMVSNIDHFDVIIADSEFEALVLECSLIKRHQPKYNILLKDDKGYPYIRLGVGEAYPRFSVVGKVAEDGARYFGPYGSRGNTCGIIGAVQEALRLPPCHKKFPRDIGKERPCLNYHIGKCDGYCRTEMDQSRYGEAIGQAVRLLDGKLDEVLDDLKGEMEGAAQALQFEKAAVLRDRLRAIELLSKRQKVVAGRLADTDVVGYHRGAAKSCFVVLHYVDGDLAAKDMEILDVPMEGELEEVVSALTREFYGGRGDLPRQILLPCELEDDVPLMRLFSESAGHRVDLITPQRGAKVELIRLAEKNAVEEVERVTSQAERQSKLLALLGKMLGLETPPNRMEAYDISNTGASDIVASMTVFENGKPRKKDYRHFKIKDVTGHPDDYHSMEEVLTRRFSRYLDGDEKFGVLPDLLLIDGGDTHAAVAE
ncbi:MAG: excinuclease ABC subunit UvrC, partial [Oscillospiraceae bacterium]